MQCHAEILGRVADRKDLAKPDSAGDTPAGLQRDVHCGGVRTHRQSTSTEAMPAVVIESRQDIQCLSADLAAIATLTLSPDCPILWREHGTAARPASHRCAGTAGRRSNGPRPHQSICHARRELALALPGVQA